MRLRHTCSSKLQRHTFVLNELSYDLITFDDSHDLPVFSWHRSKVDTTSALLQLNREDHLTARVLTQ
jgi:hypothetical protein